MRARRYMEHATSLACVAMVILSLVLVALGCSSGGDSALHESTQQTAAESTEETTGSGDFNVDDIKADYVYTSELITILYPLYGSKLDDFVIVTLTNQGKVPAKVVVKSEIPGYTDQAVDTVELGAGETLEVRQNPLLLPDVIDELNVEKPA